MPKAHGNFGIGAKKSLGQHFLTNQKVVEKMAAAAGLTKGDTVLEIGPGTGILTEGLLKTGACVIAVEADARMVALLKDRFAAALASGQLTLHHADVRTQSPTRFVPADTLYSIVANIPYYLTGMLMRGSFESAHQPERIVFLVQKEVAERITRSKKESLLSLSVKAYGTPRYVATVPRGNFAPAPKVDSAILAIDDISRARFRARGMPLDEHWFFELLHAGFASRRKQLFGNLAALCPKEMLLNTFATLAISPTVRGEDLPINEWCALATALAHTPH